MVVLIFLLQSLLLLNNKATAFTQQLHLKDLYGPTGVEIGDYTNYGGKPGDMTNPQSSNDYYVQKDEVLNHRVQDLKHLLRIFYEPSVPRPRQRPQISKELRQTIYGKLFARRKVDATQAGYTHYDDTCNHYNKNLEKVWATLSKYMKSEQKPDNMALHNIILLIKAYLDHRTLIDEKNENIQRDNKITDIKPVQNNISEIIIDKARDIIEKSRKSDTESKIVTAIIDLIKIPNQNTKENCIDLSKEKLKYRIHREFQKYLEYPDCRRNAKLLSNASSKNHTTLLRQKEKKINVCQEAADDSFLKMLKLIISGYIIDLQCLI